jgi:glycosyltransferase involved in cell wall biosynthesis
MSNINNFKISIIIPSFNKSKYIFETLKSIENQSYKNWEAIVVDDGSTDNSIQIIEKFSLKDNRFKLITRDRKPKGASTCRNIGLYYSDGKYIIFLDADDMLSFNCLRDRVFEFEKYSSMDFLIFSTATFYKKIGDSPSMWRARRDNHLKYFLSHDIPWTTTSPIWKRSFLIKLKGFDEKFPRLQDIELHTRALLEINVKYKIFSSNNPDSYYRIDESRIVDDYYTFIDKFIDGVKLYIENSIFYVKDRNPKNSEKLISYLKGTIMSAIVTILYAYKKQKISKKQKEILLKKLFLDMNNYFFLNKIDEKLIFIYIKGYELGMYHMKGYNFFFKKLFIHL